MTDEQFRAELQPVLEEIADERLLQFKKWGVQTHTPPEWLAILMEEVGEAAKEAVDFHFANPVKINGLYNTPTDEEQVQRAWRYRQELVQVVAVAVQMIQDVDGWIHK
jgi:hypothetical protein